MKYTKYLITQGTEILFCMMAVGSYIMVGPNLGHFFMLWLILIVLDDIRGKL